LVTACLVVQSSLEKVSKVANSDSFELVANYDFRAKFSVGVNPTEVGKLPAHLWRAVEGCAPVSDGLDFDGRESEDVGETETLKVDDGADE
jgi:hypothetical protein